MAIAPFPHRYQVTLVDNEIAEGPRAKIDVGAPPQFGGVDDVWSPEHLLIAAALTCLKTTFDAYARREQIEIASWRGTATGVLAKGPDGPVFTAIELVAEIQTEPANMARADHLLAIASKNCIISRSLAVPVRVTGTVMEAAERPAG